MTPPSSRRIGLTVIALLAIALAAACAAILWIGLSMSSPAPSVVGAPPKDLPGVEEVEIPVDSAAALHGWWLPAKGRGGAAVILMHGVRANRLAMVHRARVLHERGFAVLLFDFQAQGESPGDRITFGGREGVDAAAAVRFARRRMPDGRIGVLGVSLGGAAALLAPNGLDVDAMVLESVFPDIDAALTNRLRVRLGAVLGPILSPLVAPLFKWELSGVLGVKAEDLRPIDRIGAVTAPVLILSGAEDDRTPPDEARALFDQATGVKQFWLEDGAGHVDLEQFAPADYWRTVMPFLILQLHPDQ